MIQSQLGTSEMVLCSTPKPFGTRMIRAFARTEIQQTLQFLKDLTHITELMSLFEITSCEY